MAKRYPQVFRVTRAYDGKGLAEGDSIVGKNGGRVKTVEVIPVGDVWDLDKDDPMLVANLLSEDLAIMMEGPDGQYYLQAGAICVPGKTHILSELIVQLTCKCIRLLEIRRQDRSSIERNTLERWSLSVQREAGALFESVGVCSLSR